MSSLVISVSLHNNFEALYLQTVPVPSFDNDSKTPDPKHHIITWREVSNDNRTSI